MAPFAFLLAAGSASAAQTPWWNFNLAVRPADLGPGGEGTIAAKAVNVGDAPTSSPVTVSVTLPAGMTIAEDARGKVISLLALSVGQANPATGRALGKTFCTSTTEEVTCTFHIEEEVGVESEEIRPYEDFEVLIGVKNETAPPSSEVKAAISGGGATGESAARPLSGSGSFGAEQFSILPEEEGGQLDTRAGSHPFQLTTTFNLNQSADPTKPPALARSLAFKLPPGQIGNAVAFPKCSAADFSTSPNGFANLCPPDTAIGVASITFDEPIHQGLRTYPVPLFNLEPALGEPARFGFEIIQAPVVLDTSLRSGKGEDYGVTVSSSNITQLTNFLASSVTFWGAPGDSRHDESRGWPCLAGGIFARQGGFGPCEASTQSKPPAFLTLPTNCAAPFNPIAEGQSWPSKAAPAGSSSEPFEFNLQRDLGLALSGCNQLPFAPQIAAEPTSNAATSPTGLNFDINVEDEGLLNSEGLAQSQIKKAVVSLPQGFTTNPSVAEGLHACSEAAYDAASVGSDGCPDNSKIGDVEIASPLVEPIVHGSLYVAQQTQNPNHNLLTIYLIARNPEIGVLVRQALRVTPNPVTGQLTTEVDNVPELPFSHFHLSFRQGQRSPLVTPPTCGPYTVGADLYPYSNPSSPLHRESSFTITQGPEGQPCPSGTPPFHPGLEAGTVNNAAGTYSPFYTHITRKDSEQEITRFSIKLPPGVIGKLAGVSECSDAGIAQAKSRELEGGGTVETEHPSCPANSEVGHTLVGSGVGNVLAYAPGKLYLAGPYHGSNISLVSITAAKVGPFDLGTVVVRFALRIDPETAEVFVDSQGSDPIPHIVDGIPIHLRDIRAYVDRPNFTLNPTSCAKKSTASTILGSGLNFASEADDQPVTVTSPFQAADCASLGFKPKLALSLKGGTKRAATPAFKAVVTYPKGTYANIARSVVALPHSEFLEQAHIKTVCTRVQFKEGAGNGEKCPKASIYGRAEAITPLLSEPLKGPVYLRSSSHQLPDLVAALHNRQVDFDLDGRIDSFKGGIRNTFETVPDAPVSKFVLEMQGGKKGLLTNSTNLCKGKHYATSEFTGQNGKIYNTNPVVSVKCGGKGKKSKGGKGKGGH